MSQCTCTVTDPKTWTTYGDAVEPGSMLEPDPECDAHFPNRPGCPECKVQSDHTWWCGVGAAEIAAGSNRYFWRD